jgi:hypothetical protein
MVLRHVADSAPEVGRAGLPAENDDAAGRNDLHADDRPYESRLAASAGAEQAGHGARANRCRQVVEGRPAAAHDSQVVYDDSRLAGHGGVLSENPQ